MKKIILAFILFFFIFAVSAESVHSKSLELDFYGTYESIFGDYADIAKSGAGGGIRAEYQFLNLNKINLGVSGGAEYTVIFPEKNSFLKSNNDLNVLGGLFIRYPIGNFSFIPELDYGAMIHFAKDKHNSENDKAYIDSLLRVGLGIRYRLPKIENLEIEVTPVLSVCPEKENKVLTQLGVHFGAGWTISNRI